MPIYRVLRPLSGQSDGQIIERGSLSDLAHLSPTSVDKLLSRGLIVRVASPPLTEIPGWKVLAHKLAKAGIETVEQFLETQEDALAVTLKRPEGQIVEMKQSLRQVLTAEPRRG